MTPELGAILLSWAVYLSGHPMPAKAPEVKAMPHAFFVEHACGGNECRVWGWYAGGSKLYIDSRMDPASVLGSSIIVHEMVHYLQAVDRGDDKADGYRVQPTCERVIQWEQEAYAVQKAYILSFGVYLPVGMSMARVSCD